MATCLVVTAAVLPTFLTGALAVQISQDLDFGTAALGLATGAFFFAAAATSFGFGRVTERLGPVHSMQLSAALSGVVLVAVAVAARSYAALLAILALGGVANGLAQPAANLYLARVVASSRQGLAFAVKQSAIPIATLIGGLAVPLLGLTVGWRWAFVAGAGVAAAGAVLVRTATAERPAPSGQRTARRSPAARSALVPLSIGIGLGAAAAGALGTFFVTSAVEFGIGRGAAGIVAAMGGLVCVVVRLAVGLRADRVGGGHLRTVATMLALGAIGYFGIATGSAILLVLVTPLVFGAGWGWPGLFNLAIVLANPDAPGAATGITQTGTYAGAMAGPLLFGWLAQEASFEVAWLAAALAALAAAAAIRLGRQRVRAARVT